LNDLADRKVFDTVPVVSDRNVIDEQLQEALFDFQRTGGVVAIITGNDGSKSGELAAALFGDKKSGSHHPDFPLCLGRRAQAAATNGKRFAVIAASLPSPAKAPLPGVRLSRLAPEFSSLSPAANAAEMGGLFSPRL
jgi:type I restriction enzyme R subunit